MLPFRQNIQQMRAYQPGEQPSASERVIKLNTNENPYPPSPQVPRAIKAELDAGRSPGDVLRKYSDPAAMALRAAAADAAGLEVANVLHGNGSDELLAMLTRAFVNESETVAYPYPTYVLYETLAQAQGARIAAFDFDSHFTLPDKLFGCDAKLVFVASPNSPSGTVCPPDQLEALANSLPQGVLVVDEAYADFADSSALGLVPRVPNLVVLRTLSKSHSLAGMRVGLLYGPPEAVDGLWRVKDSYNLDRLAIVAGTAALHDHTWMRANAERVRATRKRLMEGLRAFGFEVVPSQANFVFARLGSAQRASSAYRYLKGRGILVRYFDARMLDDALRITVGTDEEIDTLLRELTAFVKHS